MRATRRVHRILFDLVILYYSLVARLNMSPALWITTHLYGIKTEEMLQLSIMKLWTMPHEVTYPPSEERNSVPQVVGCSGQSDNTDVQHELWAAGRTKTSRKLQNRNVFSRCKLLHNFN
jgi:hypothetical protein